MSLRLGVMFDFRVPQSSGLRWQDVCRSTLEVAAELDSCGVHGIWLTEHHFTSDAYLPQLLTMAAALSTVTSQTRIGTSILLAPLHHPIAIAEQAAIVDNLSGGRLILGMGLGYRRQEFNGFGVDRGSRGAIMDETLEVVKQAWAADAVEHSGKHFNITGVQVTPKPVQEPHPELWIGGRSVVAARRAGREATGFIWVGDDEVKDAFLASAESHGKRAEDLSVACLRSLVVPELLDVRDIYDVHRGLEWRAEHYRKWYGKAGDLPGDGDLSSAGTQRSHQAIRSLDEEVHALEALERRGVTNVIYHGTVPGVDPKGFVRQWSELASALK